MNSQLCFLIPGTLEGMRELGGGFQGGKEFSAWMTRLDMLPKAHAITEHHPCALAAWLVQGQSQSHL